jgi:hypothetical protein
MSSRKYRTYKFLYDDDRARTVIKRQRSYLNEDGITEDTPITPLFIARVVNFDEKVTGTSQDLRHLLTYVGERQLKANIPYAPGDSQLKSHIEEILAVERVECGDYRGESNLSGGISISI